MAFDNGTTLTMPVVPAYNSGGSGDGFGWGGNWSSWIILFLIFGMFGFGGGWGGFGGFGGGMNGGVGAEVQRGFDHQNVIRKLDEQTYGLADTFTALNGTLNSNFRGIDNAICTLGYQNQQEISGLSAQLAQCCCDTKGAINDVGTGVERAGWNLSKQISDCCCGVEKMNMQSRFDAQTYNCNTLQAIDKLGDRIIDYMAAERTQALRDENQALRLAASQAKQNQYLVNELRPCPVPAYITCNPYAASYGGVGYGNYGSGCGCGCG